MEQQTGSKLGKEYFEAVYCHTAYLTYMQTTSCEISGWMKHKLESRLPVYERRELGFLGHLLGVKYFMEIM